MENRPVVHLGLSEKNNVFLIDWLTFVSHVDTVDSVVDLLGLRQHIGAFESVTKFMNGYPQHLRWEGIIISYGADDPKFYKDESKARSDMGICVTMSGRGCRKFETYGHGDFNRLFERFFSGDRYNVTRLDLAYDDHTGLLHIEDIEDDVKAHNYTGPFKYAEIIWSEKCFDLVKVQKFLEQDPDELRKEQWIVGRNIQVGSDTSDTKIRIYDKAAERGFVGIHWVRCEIQLRRKNAFTACAELYNKQHIGSVCVGILRNYLLFRQPTADTNKSRWPIRPYWERLLLLMPKVKLWITPGEPYNYRKTVDFVVKQFGKFFVFADIYGIKRDIFDEIELTYGNRPLPEKYRIAGESIEKERQRLADERRRYRSETGIGHVRELENYPGFPDWVEDQIDFAELLPLEDPYG